MIRETVYKPRSMSSCYQRLNLLEKNRYIDSFCSIDAKNWFWQLTDKSFKLLKLKDLHLEQVGFKSEHKYHDLLVTLFHLGLWNTFQNENSDIFTEQELRRVNLESFPDWVPRTRMHRPDGWLKTNLDLKDNSALIAIEVELNLKERSSYESLGEHYSDYLGVGRVLWVVRTETDAKFIYKNLQLKSYTKASEHSFIILSQWRNHLWQTPIFLGKDQGLKLQDILNTSLVTVREPGMDKVLFNFYKKPINSRALKQSNEIYFQHSKIRFYP
jgi:hypothetical protein